MKNQYNWIWRLIPKFNVKFSSRNECDDEYVAMSNDFEGGHSHGPSDADLKLYKASMFKLKLVSFVSTFFIVA